VNRGTQRQAGARTRSVSKGWVTGAMLALGAIVGAGTVRADAASLDATWTAPTTNADGSPLVDLAGYRLYLGTGTPACPGPSFHSLVSTTLAPTPGQTIAYRISSLVAGTTYFTAITAVDGSGNESPCTAPVSAVARADVSVSPTAAVNLGTTTTGTAMDAIFTVQNPTASTVTAATSVSAPFSVVSGSSFTLAPGASQPVTVRFRSTTAGSFASNVTFTANGGDTLSRAVRATAVGSPLTLSVTRAGIGTGTITSAPAGIACGTDCTETVAPGTAVTLTAAATEGSTFAGWSGGCSGTGTCAVTLNTSATVTATFNVIPVATPAPPRVPAPAPVPSAAEIIIDNAPPGVQDHAGGRTFTGRWCLAGAEAEFRSTSLRSCGRRGDTYRWTPRIPAAGTYDVYVWIPTDSVRSRAVPILVSHAKGMTTRLFDERRATGTWVLHGRYSFGAGTSGYVQTTDIFGPAAADAVRLVPVK
jgi:Divergent InlB B-repeat domain